MKIADIQRSLNPVRLLLAALGAAVILTGCATPKDDWVQREDGPDTSYQVYFEDGEWRMNFGPLPKDYIGKGPNYKGSLHLLRRGSK